MPHSSPDASRVPRVAISLLTLFPGGHGGGEVYAREVVARVSRDPRVSVDVFLPRNAAGWNSGVAEKVVSIESQPSGMARLVGFGRIWAKSRALRQRMSASPIVHYPLTIPLPRRARGQKSVVSLADTQHLDLPDLFHPLERTFRRFTYDRAAQRADAVVTISEFTKARIVHHLGVEPERVHVAHLGADLGEFAPNHGAREDFLFYPARAWRHKNHQRLFEAFALLRRDRPDLRLVLSGGDIDKLGPLPAGVESVGFVDDATLAKLYRSAALLVFPSLYEGFGLPPLEALASGCPVVAARTGSIPEICGSAAVYFDPESAESIAAGVTEGLARAAELSQLGPARAAEFTWANCVDVHVELYEQLSRSTR